jgi:release factor glutamine methyltransferase
MRPAQVLARAADYLERHGVGSPGPTAERLLMHVLRTDRAGIHRRDGLTTEEARRFGRALCRRCAGDPVQYLTGDEGFRDLTLLVRPGVFIPRPETEVLVDVVLRMLAGRASPTVVDVGTGTGAIALAIRQERPDATVLAPEAVALARENASALSLDVDVLEGDLLDPLPPELRGRVDAVVANPPYVPPGDRASLAPHVLAEPALALFGTIEVYVRLFEAAGAWLRPGGLVAVEIEERAAADVSAAARAAGFEGVEVTRDLAARDRVVTARRPGPP